MLFIYIFNIICDAIKWSESYVGHYQILIFCNSFVKALQEFCSAETPSESDF